VLQLGLSMIRILALPAIVALVGASTGCNVKYRHEVEKPGTPAKHTYSAGGFMRYDGYDDIAGDMEIAVREYERPGSGSKIRLVGVIHIGDLEYYQTLQKEELDTSDVVLFEGVKFEGQEEQEEAAKKAPDIGGLYEAMSQLLGIGFQKDGIDYKSKNFVHCDVTLKPGDPLFQQVDPEQIAQASQMIQPIVMMKGMLSGGQDPRRLEDALKHGMVNMMAMQMGGMDQKDAAKKAAEMMGRGGEENDPMAKRAEKAMEQLKKIGPAMPGMDPAMMTEILDKRNDYVLAQLKARLDADGDAKKQTIAVFYGAAHNQGLEAEMLNWGYKPVETRWYKAWRMNSKGKAIAGDRLAGAGETPSAVTPSKPATKQGKTEQPRQPAKRREPTLF